MALKKRSSQRRHQRRAALPLAFPELHPRLKDLPPPTALRVLQTPPPPAAVLRRGRTGLLEQWQRRRDCGQWRAEKFPPISALAQDSMGRTDP
jgi:hypothetical protein